MWNKIVLLCLIGGAFTLEDPRPRPPPGGPPDRVEVVSSALRILPRRRERRSAPSWRKPREYEFVTRREGEGSRSPRRLPYPDEESYPPQDYFERRRDHQNNRRIIYYATLPEIIRRPGEWTPPRPIYYPPPSQNEIVTRVHSGLIDVSNFPDKYTGSSSDRYNTKYSSDRFNEELPPRFTIIDAEPPYNRPPPPLLPSRNGGPVYDRYDYTRHDYNRYDYRNKVDPYRSYYDLPPFRHEQLPAQPVTVVRRPVDIPRPLDIRPLDVRPLDLVPLHPLSTQAPPALSSTTTQSTSTKKPSEDISSFERSLKT